MEITFTHPNYLIFLFFIPVIILFHFIGLRRKRKNALKFANFEAIARIKGIDIYSRNLTVLFFYVSIVLLIVLALSGATLHKEKTVSSFSFVIAVDASRSMEATDLVPSRIDVAKSTALEFVDELPIGVKVGIISFSSNAIVEEEVVDNKDLIKRAIRSIELSSIGGTDIYNSVATSINILRGEDSKAVIILSDGQINVGNINDTIEYAKRNDAILHTIAMGTTEGGETSYGVSVLDENSLKALSFGTGGEFFRATSREELKNSFDVIQGLKIGKASILLSSYCLFAALFLFIIYYLISTLANRVIS